MKVLLSGAFQWMDVRVGFGNASYYIYKSLKKQGIDVIVQPPDDYSHIDADIEISFCHPNDYNFLSSGYRIGYTPWESTEFLPGWKESLEDCDEIWVTSYFNKKIFEANLPDRDVFVYQHGINPLYLPKKHRIDNSRPFTFLYIGEPSARKNGRAVVENFIKLFGNDKNYLLIVKGVNESSIRIPSPHGDADIEPSMIYSNIITILDSYTISEMIELYRSADVFLYPSWGEGWGFNPFQAIATGLPTISTFEWADYQDLITVHVNAEWAVSPWPDIHPGYMLRPINAEFKKAMSIAKDNYQEWADITFKNALELHKKYNWDEVTKPVVERLQKIYKTL